MMCSRTYLSFSNCFVNFEGFQFVCANHLFMTKTKWFTLPVTELITTIRVYMGALPE